jgi:acetoin utilization protein AcuB
MVVEDCMSVDPFVVQVTESVGGVLSKLLEADVRHLPVVNEGMLVGIVSDRDLQRALVVAFPGGSLVRADHPLEQPISTLMCGDVISVNPETEIEEVIDLMIDHKIGAVPVVESDSLKVIGIVSYIDLLRVARSALV